MSGKQTLEEFKAEQAGRLGSGVEAIKFALKIDDHHNREAFLDSWLHGDLSEWPEFDARIEDCTPEDGA